MWWRKSEERCEKKSKKNEIGWTDFVNEILPKEQVEKLVVVDRDYVRVHLPPAPESPKVKRLRWFAIGNPSSFEAKLEKAQAELGPENKTNIPVFYEHNNDMKHSSTVSDSACNLLNLALMTGFMAFGYMQFKSTFLNDNNSSVFKSTDVDVRFRDVAGCEEAKIEIMELVNFLKNPEYYYRLGAKIPRGALLTGPPGSGKTLLAKAAAGEANVPFISASASSFDELYVGMGTMRVRKLFLKARELAPCILFIDEIDAVGGKRHKLHSEETKTLNQILVEMDGFDTTTNVIVLGATNRPDALDPALLRPGRFDRKIQLQAPDIKGRVSIFKVHLKPLLTADDKEILAKTMAALTPGFTGADIANTCNEGALIAARENSPYILVKHLELAIERVIGGMERKTKILSVEEKKVVAYHEAGHAVASWFLPHAPALLKISIVPRGDALGYVMYLPKDHHLISQEQLFDMMCMELGGRVSEQIFFNQMTTGAQDDLRKVTNSAYKQMLYYGMSEKIGPVSFDLNAELKLHSESTSQLVDEEVRNLIGNAINTTRKLLNDHKADIVKVAERLIIDEVINRDDLIELLGKRPFSEKLSFEELVEETGSQEENTTLPESLREWDGQLSFLL